MTEPTPALRTAIRLLGQLACVGCGAVTFDCQIDHIRPRHAGGQAIPVNMALLCPGCNLVKSCYWPWHGYHPFEGNNDPARAANILDAELAWIETRHSPREILDGVWGEDCEPGTWAFRRLPDGTPKWLTG